MILSIIFFLNPTGKMERGIILKFCRKKGLWLRLGLLAAGMFVIGLLAGCTSQFVTPYDLNNLCFDYQMVSDSDNGSYIIITKHLVSQSDVNIPDEISGVPVRGIAPSVFAEEETLHSVTFGSEMKSIGANAFGNCPALTSVTFSVSASDMCIGEYAFTNCTALTAVEIPAGVTSVGRGAFYGCKALKDITVADTLSDIGGRAFAGTPWLKSAAKKDKFVTVGDGVLIAYTGDKVDVKIPGGVKHISGAFAGNTTVKNIKLHKKVRSIGDMAFKGCEALETVTIPDGLQSVGKDAFYGCTQLKWVILKDKVTFIGEDAFAYCGAAIYVNQGSAAEAYCIKHQIAYCIM